MRRERGHAFRKRQVSDNHLVLTRRGWIERALLAATWGVGVPAAAQNDNRVALVIGNSTYSNAPLPNAAHDARAVSAVRDCKKPWGDARRPVAWQAGYPICEGS